MKIGDYIRAESNGEWRRFQGVVIVADEKEITIEATDGIKVLKRELFHFTKIDAWGREIK